MIDFIFHPLENRQSNDEIRRCDDDCHNLVRAELFDIFPNVRNMTIYTGDKDDSFSFSLIAFSNIVSNSKLYEIRISTKYEDNWIQREWEMNSQLLTNKYAKNGYSIKMEIMEEKVTALKIERIGL